MLDPELDLAENDDVEALGGLAALEQDRTAVHMQGLGPFGDPVDLVRSQFAKQRDVGEKRLDPYRGRRHGTRRPDGQASRAQAAGHRSARWREFQRAAILEVVILGDNAPARHGGGSSRPRASSPTEESDGTVRDAAA